MIRVSVGTYPGQVRDQAMTEGSTVQQALTQAELSVGSDSEIRVNSAIASMDRVLEDGDLVLISRKVKGN